MKIGLISDTHGQLRPQAVAALRGCELILHAGDVGKPLVLEGLAELAPTHAVAGNVDTWAHELPERLELKLLGRRVLLVHDRKSLSSMDLVGVQIVVSGHSHKPLVEWVDGVLFVNPGSAGRRRFKLPVCLAVMELEDEAPVVRRVDLLPAPT